MNQFCLLFYRNTANKTLIACSQIPALYYHRLLIDETSAINLENFPLAKLPCCFLPESIFKIFHDTPEHLQATCEFKIAVCFSCGIHSHWKKNVCRVLIVCTGVSSGSMVFVPQARFFTPATRDYFTFWLCLLLAEI